MYRDNRGIALPIDPYINYINIIVHTQGREDHSKNGEVNRNAESESLDAGTSRQVPNLAKSCHADVEADPLLLLAFGCS